MERNFAARGVFACIEARIERPHDITAVFDWSFQNRWESDDREPQPSGPGLCADSRQPKLLEEDGSYPRTGHRDGGHFRIRRRYLRPKAAVARRRRLPREHGAALPESAEDMAAVVENHPYFTSFGLRRIPKYRKMDKHEMFRQAVEDAVASVLCQEIEPQTEGDASTPG